MFLRRSLAPRRIRSRSALNSSPPRYCPNVSVSPLRTRGSVRRSAINSAELLLTSLLLTSLFLSVTPRSPSYCCVYKYRAGTTRRRGPYSRRSCWLLSDLLHVLDKDAPAGARTLHIGEVHAQLASLAPGGVRGVHLPVVFGLQVSRLFGHARVRNVAFSVEHLLDDVPGLVSRPSHDLASLVYVLLFDLQAAKRAR